MERENKARMIIAIENMRKAAVYLCNQAQEIMRHDKALLDWETRRIEAFEAYAQSCAAAMEDQLIELGVDGEVWT